jgi:hypothetical protein
MDIFPFLKITTQQLIDAIILARIHEKSKYFPYPRQHAYTFLPGQPPFFARDLRTQCARGYHHHQQFHTFDRRFDPADAVCTTKPLTQ